MMNFLHSHPMVRRRGEILNRDEVIYGNFEGAPKERVLLHIRAMYFTLPGQMKVAKLMDSQIEDHGLTLENIIEALRSPYIIAVYRRDLLSAYVSLKIAEQNGIWYSTDSANDEGVYIDLPELRDYVQSTRGRWRRNVARLRAYDRARIVAYEDFADMPEPTMYDIFDLLDLPRAEPATETVKQNPAPLDLKVKNFYELRLDELLARGEFTLRLEPAPSWSFS